MMQSPMISQEQEQHQLRLEFLLLHLARHQGTFDVAYAQLNPDLLNKPSEMHYRHIWRCMREHWERHGQRPTYEALCVAVLEAVANDPITRMDNTIGEQILEQTQAVLDFMYSARHTPDQLEPKAAIWTLQELLLEREPAEDIRRAARDTSIASISNLPAIVARAQRRIEDITALGKVDEDYSTVPTTWAKIAVPRIATGVEFVDSIMGGGGEPGYCNVLIGPTGGGKTTLSMQLAASSARLQSQLQRRGSDGSPGLIVFVSYEDDLRMLQIRATSFGARVLKDRLMKVQHDSELSRVGRLEQYEQQMYAGRGAPREEQLGEAERIEQAKPWLNKYLQLVDYHDPSQGGRGGVPEVRTKLTALQDKHGLPVKMVVLDWAGNLVWNHLSATGKTPDGGQMSLQLQGLVNQCKHEIAAPFKCVVWLPHQLKGTLNTAPATRFPHHGESQWCSTFADHAWYAFVLGNKDKEHSICQFGATKTRHGETPPPMILKINGAWCRMDDVSKVFQIDKIAGRLVSTKDAERIYDPDKIQTASADVNSR